MLDSITIKFIENALQNGEDNITKLPKYLLDKTSVNSYKIRILLNNICDFLGCHYFQYHGNDGVALCSALYGNSYIVDAQVYNEYENNEISQIFNHQLNDFKLYSPSNLLNKSIHIIKNDIDSVRPFNVFYIDGSIKNTNYNNVSKILDKGDDYVIFITGGFLKTTQHHPILNLINKSGYVIIADWYKDGHHSDPKQKENGWYEGLKIFLLYKSRKKFNLFHYKLANQSLHASINRCIQGITAQVVITRFSEDVRWTKYLNIPYTIYNKGSPISYNTNTIDVPNISREDYGYLKYIIDNYNNLPDFLICLQGHPFDHEPRIIEIINSKILFENESFFVLADFCEQRQVDCRNVSISAYVDCPDDIDYFMSGGQFSVCKKFILNRSLEFYQRLLQDVEEGRIDGWKLENFWGIIFNPEYRSKI